MTFNKMIRPLSPHLSIYKPQLTSTLSIFHRITGTILSLVMIAALVAFKFYSFHGSNYYVSWVVNFANESMGNWFFSSILFILMLSFYYHTLNGIRHLCWDLGYGLELKDLYTTGYIVLVSAFVLSVFTWILPGFVS